MVDALDTDDEETDPSFELESSMVSDTNYMVKTFCEDWVSHHDREDCVSLSLFLCFQLTKHLALGETKAAELSGAMIGKSNKTIREWRKQFFENDGTITEAQQGRYERSGIVWSSEELNRKATVFIRANASVKGQPNLTVGKFCQWVNDDLLVTQHLNLAFPERLALKQYRNTFLRRMAFLGFLNYDNAPTDEARNALPSDLEAPDLSVLEIKDIYEGGVTLC